MTVYCLNVTKVFKTVHTLDFLIIDVYVIGYDSLLTEINYHFFSFVYVKDKEIFITPGDK